MTVLSAWSHLAVSSTSSHNAHTCTPPQVSSVAKVGGALRVRVIGFRLMDGLAAVTGKQSVVEQQVR